MAVFWRTHAPLPRITKRMIAVIGNLAAGLLALSLFTATVRLSR
jgi:hypothetical protein